MRASHLLLAVLITAIWGVNFSVIKLGLQSVDPFMLAGIRFVLCALPLVLFFRFPKVKASYVVAYGLLFGVGLWGVVNLGIQAGLSAGIASLVLQFSAFFTILLGAAIFRESVSGYQYSGIIIALLGLALIITIRPETRVVGVTWVHSGTGVVLPIRAVGDALAKVNRNRDDSDRVLLVVDGVHGFGVLDEDIARQGSDFFSAGTHKWILGPHGTGMVWGRNESWALLKPTVPSLMASELMAAWREGHPPKGPVTAARISPGGFFAYEHQWAVTAAYGFHKSLGRTRITNRILDLNGWLIEGLSKMKHVTMHTPSKRDLHAGFVCFEVDQMATEEVGARLRSKGIIASPSPYANPSVRFAAGIVNSEADIERALKAVRSLA